MTEFTTIHFNGYTATTVPRKVETPDEVEWMQSALRFAFERGRQAGRNELKKEFKSLFSIY